jgi:DNA-binding transcriptional LysR family regulator
METLQGMRLFVSAVRTGSFSAAGRQMGLSPASVSRHIASLEDSLRARLFYRTSRKLALTEVGQLYFDRVSAVIREIDDLGDAVSQHQMRPHGILLIHTRLQLGTLWLTPALPYFQRRYPEIKIKLWLTEEPRDVIENKIDVAIRLGNLDEPSLTVRKLAEGMERIVFASPAYLAAHAPIREPEDLLSHNCLTYLGGRSENEYSSWRFRNKKRSCEIDVAGSFQANNPEALRYMVVAGLGLAILPEWAIMDDLKAGRVTRVLSNYKCSPTTFDHCIYAVYQRSRHLAPKIRVFLDFAAQVFRGGPKQLQETWSDEAGTALGPPLAEEICPT